MIVVELPGEPQGKGRPRSRVAYTRDDRAFVAIYTPAATVAYEKALATVGRAAMRGRAPLRGALDVRIIAVMSVPQSWSTKKRDAALAGTIRPTGKPDLDNIMKMLDAFQAKPARKGKLGTPPILWQDDSQIVRAVIEKLYGEKPRLRIEVRELEALLFDAVDSIAAPSLSLPAR